MIFTAAIATPANTSKTAPVKTQIPIVFGTITQIMVWFPPGVDSLTHLKLLWGLYQLFPSNEQGDLTGGGVLIPWPEDITIDTQPAQLTAVTWNDDDTYPHTINVHVVMTPASGNSNAATVAAELIAAQGSNPGGSQ